MLASFLAHAGSSIYISDLASHDGRIAPQILASLVRIPQRLSLTTNVLQNSCFISAFSFQLLEFLEAVMLSSSLIMSRDD